MLLTKSHANWWEPQDERFEDLRDIANAINDAIDLAHGDAEVVWNSEMIPDLYPVWTPTRLVKRMREVADRIEALTEVN